LHTACGQKNTTFGDDGIRIPITDGCWGWAGWHIRPMHPCYRKYSLRNVCWQTVQRHKFQYLGHVIRARNFVYGIAGRKSRREEKMGQSEAKMDRQCQRLVEQNRDGVFTRSTVLINVQIKTKTIVNTFLYKQAFQACAWTACWRRLRH